MTVTLQELKPSELKPHKLNPRHDVGDVTELAASIQERGIVEPLIVAPNATGSGYVLIAGHRRHAAAKSIRMKTVPCLVRDDLTDPHQQVEVMLIENVQRSDLSPVEEAEAYQQLLAFPGYTQKRISETTGRAIATVRARLKIGKLPKNALESIHNGQISLAEASALAEIDGEPEFAQVAKAAGTNDFAWQLRQAKDAKTYRRAEAKARDRLEAEGVRIVKRTYGASQQTLYGDDAVEQHRACEGFAACIGYGGRVEYVCTKPELHAEEKNRAEVERDETDAADRAAMRDAAQKRRQFLARSVLNEVDEDLALRLMRELVVSAGSKLSWMPEVLGMTALIDTIETGPPTAKDVRAKLEQLDLLQLVIVHDFITNSAERNLEDPNGWGLGWYDSGKKWRDRIVDLYGYEWSDVELELLARSEAKHDAESDGETS